MTARSVVFPYTGTEIGGSDVSSALLARELLENVEGYAPTMAVPSWGRNAKLFVSYGLDPVRYEVDAETIAQVRDTRSWASKLGAAPGHWRIFQAAHAFLRSQRPDLLHVSDSRTILPWGAAARSLDVPVVWHVRSSGARPLSDRLRLRLADHLIFVADRVRIRFPEPVRIPGTTVYNPVDLQAFRPSDRTGDELDVGLDRRRTTICLVGNLIPRKRPEWALQALVDLIEEGERVELLVVGDDWTGDYRSRLDQMVRGTDAEDVCHLLGFRDDIAEILRASDVVVLTSRPRGEGFPRVIIEAMASGVPVVATDVAGVPEAIDDGVTGLICDPRDYPDFLSKLRRLVDDEELRRRMGSAGRDQAVGRFSAASTTREVVAAYDRLIGT